MTIEPVTRIETARIDWRARAQGVAAEIATYAAQHDAVVALWQAVFP